MYKTENEPPEKLQPISQIERNESNGSSYSKMMVSKTRFFLIYSVSNKLQKDEVFAHERLLVSFAKQVIVYHVILPAFRLLETILSIKKITRLETYLFFLS